MKLNKQVVAFLVLGFSGTAFAHDNNTQAQIDQLKADIHTVHMSTLSKYSESWGLEDRANIAKLQSGKVDKSVFEADQARQDKQVAQYAAQGAAAYNELKSADADQNKHINAVQDAAQAANEHADRLDVRADNIEKQAANLDTRVGGTEQRLDTVEGNVRDTNDHLTVVDQRSQNNSVRLDGVEQKNTDQDTHINAVQAAAQTANDRAGNLEVRADKTESAIRETNAQVAVTDQRSINNATRLDGVETVNTAQDKRLNANESDIQSLYGQSSVTSQRLEASNRNIAANKAALESTNKVVSAHSKQLADHEQRLNTLEQSTNSRFSDIDKRLNNNRDRADAGTSAALASSAIPQVTGDQRFSLGAGVGGYGGQNAIAVGFSSRVTNNVVLKASVTNDTQHNVGYNVGASVGW